MNYKKAMFVGCFCTTVGGSARAEVPLPAGFNVAGQNTGVEGANRRVLTNPSTSGQPYSGVRGTFDVPTIFIPSGQLVAPSVVPSRANSKPTFYLGAAVETPGSPNNGFEIDAGIQYEWQAVVATTTDPNTGVVTTRTVPSGYIIFVNSHTPQYSPRVDQRQAAGAWRCGPGTENPLVSSFELEWKFEPSRLAGTLVGFNGKLSVVAVNANQQPRDPNDGRIGVIYAKAQTRLTLNLAGMRMKRVAGITQGGASYRANLQFPLNPTPPYTTAFYQEDGSYMLNCDFKDGRVATNGINPIWQDWNTLPGGGDIDQSSTGTAPATTATDRTFTQPPALRGIPAPGSSPVFTFSYPTGSVVIPPISTPAFRYRDERVNIYLRRAVPTFGDNVSPGDETAGVS